MPQHVAKSQLTRWAAVLFLTVLLSPGCAHTTTVTAWSPAEIELTDVKTIAVLDLSGNDGGSATQILAAGLRSDEHYNVVDRQEIQPVQWTTAHSGRNSLLTLDDLNAAHESNVDAVVTGDVLESSCFDRPIDEQDSADSGDRPPHELLTNGTTVHREARVTIDIRLIDVKTSDVRLARQISRSYSAEVVLGQSGTQTHREVLDDLTRKCVDEFTRLLSPQEHQQKIALAEPSLFDRGYSLVWNGNQFACRGCWEEAIVSWEQAIAKNPDHDAALYNLAIAHAHRQDFARAEQLAIKAVNLRHKPQYEAGLNRIRKQMSDYDVTVQQRCDLGFRD
ncbi:MAG: tetratricopeptide repeat protein [Planctomycetaceae bacterium]|nr:tetratricopeptide repeat protein [Planctomycetaceae bacterium]